MKYEGEKVEKYSYILLLIYNIIYTIIIIFYYLLLIRKTLNFTLHIFEKRSKLRILNFKFAFFHIFKFFSTKRINKFVWISF